MVGGKNLKERHQNASLIFYRFPRYCILIPSFDSNLFPGYPIVAIMSSGSGVETQGYFTLKGECSLDFPDSHFNLMMTGKEPDHISSDVELTEVITI